MGSKELKEFFRQKKEKASLADEDWQAKRDAWIKSVDELFDTIENQYLAGVKSNVALTRTGKSVREPLIGDYSIDELILTVGNEVVVFSPKGAHVHGAAGRVDVRGDRDEATLVRQLPDRWLLVVSRTPTLRLVPLDENTFLEMLRGIMR